MEDKNFEALGRYTDAVARAKKHASDVAYRFQRIGNLTSCRTYNNWVIGCEYDFAAIAAELESAQSDYEKLVLAVADANAAAAACGRKPVELQARR